MNIYTAIGVGITIAGFIGGIITAVAKFSELYTRTAALKTDFKGIYGDDNANIL